MTDCSDGAAECVANFTLHMPFPWNPPTGGCCDHFRLELDGDPNADGFMFATLHHSATCDVWRFIDPDIREAANA